MERISSDCLKKLYILLLLLLSPIAIFLSLCIGPAHIDFFTVISTLLGGGSGVERTIILDIRLPRILTVYIAGFSLATAGTMAQAVFKNPLGDPYLLGISSGASLGAVVSFLICPSLTPVLAFIFAIGVTFFVYSLSKLAGGTPYTLILAGIAVGMFVNAIVLYLIMLLKELHGIYFWLNGTFSTVAWTDFYTVLPLIVISSLTIFIYKWLNMFLLSDAEAMSLGLNIKKAREIVIVLIALLTATTVSVAGIIGFVGLVVPHISRLIVGANHKYLLPSSMLFGGIFLLIADTIARLGSAEIPVGVITAMMGAPLFAYLLVRSRVKG